MSIGDDYNRILKASYVGYITQAVVNNFIPLLFLTLQSSFGISLEKITLLMTINFGIQLLVDLLSVKFMDKIGCRTTAAAVHIFTATEIAGLGVFPDMFPDSYLGPLFYACLYAMGGGLIEVLISPIVEAYPTEKKDAAMSLFHSFYCRGSVLIIAVSALSFTVFGIENWRAMALLQAVVPAGSAIFFTSVPIAMLAEEGQGTSIRSLLREETFWVFAFVIVCVGASEQAMSQWASTFAGSRLQVSKTMGGMAGPYMFVILMGVSRTFYARFGEKMNLVTFVTDNGVLCIFNYMLATFSTNPILALVGCDLYGLSVGILWSGAFSLVSAACPRGGAAMFALLVLAGDLDRSTGPTLAGLASNTAGGSISTNLIMAIAFPVLLIVALSRVRGNKAELEGKRDWVGTIKWK